MLEMVSTRAEVLPLIIFIFSFNKDPASPEKRNCMKIYVTTKIAEVFQILIGYVVNMSSILEKPTEAKCWR